MELWNEKIIMITIFDEQYECSRILEIPLEWVVHSSECYINSSESLWIKGRGGGEL